MPVFAHNVRIYTNLNRELVETVKYPVNEGERTLFCEALNAAQRSEHRFKVGAALMDRNGVDMWAGWNTSTQHAEIRMLSVVPHEYRAGAMVAVARLGRRNDWRCSYPCEDCLKALRRFGVVRVVCLDEHHSLVSFVI